MRLDKDFVRYWSSRYENEELGSSERELLSTTHDAVAERGYLTPDELTKIVRWKTPRALGVLTRDDGEISDVSRVALASEVPPWMRHRILCILAGVGHPVASAILTVWDPETQTMYDFRAVEALEGLWAQQALDLEPAHGTRKAMPGYWTYLEAYRPIAASVGVDHRGLDRALWMWHKAGMPQNWPGCE